MRLWTIQTIEAFNVLMETGVLKCPANIVEDLYKNHYRHLDAYKWLVMRMYDKIGEAPYGAFYPLWGWYKIDWENKKPDFRTLLFKSKEPEVCIEFEIPDDKVVLSDYNSWHNVLNDRFYNTSTNEESFWKVEEWFDSLSKDMQEKVTKSSWEDVFDITPFQNDFCWNGRYVQATFWEITKDQVVSYKIRNAKRKS